jgi:hypothetical protein
MLLPLDISGLEKPIRENRLNNSNAELALFARYQLVKARVVREARVFDENIVFDAGTGFAKHCGPASDILLL